MVRCIFFLEMDNPYIYIYCKLNQLEALSLNSTPNDTLHAHIYCTFPPVHNCAPEDGWT